MTLTARRMTTGTLVCGFCQSGNCEHCPRAVRNGNGAVLPCNCSRPYCGGQVLRCLDCKNENDGEVSPDDWRCLDREACAVEVRRRLDSNPHIQMVREVLRRVSENTGTETAEKVAKAPKAPTHCLHCGEPTRGGKFLPGHDARWVAQLVLEVVDQGSRTEDAVATDMTERGASETLVGKFRKSVKLAREDREKRAKVAAEVAEKKAAAEKEAADKLAAKAAKENAVAVPPAEAKAAPVKSAAKVAQKA
jgi:hypothetical protein